MIVGTAGHIDHGKTTLVRALTGVDTDRLPEEKKRGVTIELGYAFLDVAPGRRIGFIDVPGHERLVHTMLAGATGIDHALLLVAADDGVMPQTREHLAVLSLLGIARGAAVITKCDRVDPDRVARVRAEVDALLADTPLAGAPVLPVSAHTGEGIDALRALLAGAAEGHARDARPGEAFRIAIDRAFALDGAGTVVTGTIHAGEVAIGDTLRLVPGDATVRVRSLHAQNRPVERARAGERCAMAIVGVERQAIDRGQWLVSPDAALATDRIDVSLALWHDEPRALRSGTPVHVHLGSATCLGTVALLDDGDALAPGATARVQVVLRARVGAWHGDRVVLRDASASRTIAGGVVLDPHGPVRYRRTPQRLAELDALGLDTPARRLAALLDASPHGVELRRFMAAQGRVREGAVAATGAAAAIASPIAGQPEAAPGHPADGLSNGFSDGALRRADPSGDWALGARHAAHAREAALAALATYHDAHPDELGPDSARLRRLALPRLAEPLWRELVARLQQDGAIAVRGACVHLPAHGVRLSAGDERIAQKIGPMLADAGFDGAWVRDLARDARESEPVMRVALARLAQRGDLHQVVRDLYYPSPTIGRLAAIVRACADAGDGEVTAARFRDATQLGRKRAIQILEHFDRVGLLRRVGDTHRLRRDSAWLEAVA